MGTASQSWRRRLALGVRLEQRLLPSNAAIDVRRLHLPKFLMRPLYLQQQLPRRGDHIKVARQLPTLVNAGDKCKTTIDGGCDNCLSSATATPTASVTAAASATVSATVGTKWSLAWSTPFSRIVDTLTACLCVYGSCRLILIQVPPNMISVSSAFQL